MRHGSVSYFDPSDPVSQEKDRGLSAVGRAEAGFAAAAFRGVPFDRVVTSGLRRAVETAEIVVAGRGLEIEVHPDLSEIRSGALRDIPAETAEEEFCLAFHGIVRGSRFLRGDPFGSWCDRVLPAFAAICTEPGWTQLLAVLHGGVNRLVLAHALGLSLHEETPIDLGVLEQEPCCINVIDIEESGRALVRLLNFTPGSPVKQGVEETTMEYLYRAFSRR